MPVKNSNKSFLKRFWWFAILITVFIFGAACTSTGKPKPEFDAEFSFAER